MKAEQSHQGNRPPSQFVKAPVICKLRRKTMSKLALLVYTVLCSLAMPAVAAPLGNAYRLNNDQVNNNAGVISISTGNNGDDAILWAKWPDNSSNTTFIIQRYDYIGNPAAPIAIPNIAAWYNAPVSIADNSNGRFAITRTGLDGVGSGVYLSVYDRTGKNIVPEFLVNQDVVGNQIPIKVVMNSAGMVAVYWWVNGGAGTPANNACNSFALFKANGTRQTGDIPISLCNSGIAASDISIDDGGNVTIVGYAGISKTWLKRFNLYGIQTASIDPLGNTGIVDLYPAVATTPDGSASIVVWDRRASLQGGQWSAVGVKVDNLGRRVGSSFTIATLAANSGQAVPNVAIRSDGKFVVTWVKDYYSQTPMLYAQAFNANTTPVAAAFPVGAGVGKPTYTRAQIAMDPDPLYDNYTISWTVTDANGHSNAYAQRFNMK
jgi:hypothetical protein